MESVIMKAIEENPRPAIYAGAGAFVLYKWLIFDPYRRCSMYITILTAISTYALIGGFMYISFEAWNMHLQEIFKTLTSLAGLAGTVFTSYSVYKNLKGKGRHRRIRRRRNNDENQG